MYSIIYDLVFNNLIGALPSGVSDTHINDLGLILTHCGVVLFYVVCVFIVVWIFKVFAGLLKL